MGYGLPLAEAAVLRTLGPINGHPIENRLTPLFSMVSAANSVHFYTPAPQEASAMTFDPFDPPIVWAPMSVATTCPAPVQLRLVLPTSESRGLPVHLGSPALPRSRWAIPHLSSSVRPQACLVLRDRRQHSRIRSAACLRALGRRDQPFQERNGRRQRCRLRNRRLARLDPSLV